MADTLYLLSDGRRRMGGALVEGLAPPAALHMGLFHDPAVALNKSTLPADILAAEAVFSTYARLAVPFLTYAGVVGGKDTWTGTALLWALFAAPASGDSIVGYFLYDDTNGKVLLIGVLAGGAVPMAAAGDALSVTPTFQADSIN